MTSVLLISVLSLFGSNFDRQIPLANNQANQLFESQDYQAALDAYLDAFKKDSKNGALAYNIGNTYSALGDQEKAVQFYQKAKAADHPEARQLAEFNLGNLAMAQKNPNEAMQHYINYLKNQPNDIDAKRNLELALRQLQQQEQQQNPDDKKQDKDKQDQQEQQEQQQSQDQEGENQDQQDQQNQDQQDENQDQQDQEKQDQQKQDQDQEDQQKQDQQQSKPQDQDKPQKQEQEQKQQQAKEQQEKQMDENLKKQILDALNEQELQQQKAHQKRKIGKVKRRSKDW